MSNNIQLNNNRVAIVDDEDFDWLNQWKWCTNRDGYAVRGQLIKNKIKSIQMTRLIMDCPKDMQVDHINHNILDNRRQNLRICTKQENSFNQLKHRDGKSDFKGVVWHKHAKKWMSYIGLNNKKICLGYFDNPRHAAMAYDLWAKDLFGEFASLNF